jgi:uncharacterized damage-inducible protein DinB
MPAVVRPVTDERDALVTFLAHQRHVVRIATHGLTDEQATLTPTRSALSLAGVVAHLTSVERSWAGAMSGSLPGEDADATPVRLPQLLEDYDGACAATDAVLSSVADLGARVPVPAGVRWAPADHPGWSVRWVLLHLIHETARHAGHADIIRESIDGATALPLMAAVEQWPPRRTIRPWAPPAD